MPARDSRSTPRSRVGPARDRIGPLRAALQALYGDAFTGLRYENPFQLLIATILSAQCTDARVNQTTPALFARYPTPQALAAADLAELERLIGSITFFRNKAKNIRSCSAALVERFGGQVPARLEDLVTLPGVGRKTANVVVSQAFATPGITVDTHVRRLARRLGLTRHTDPAKIEQTLMRLVPRSEWTAFSHRLITHGRTVCHARNPRCGSCPLAHLCPRIGVRPRPGSEGGGTAHPTS